MSQVSPTSHSVGEALRQWITQDSFKELNCQAISNGLRDLGGDDHKIASAMAELGRHPIFLKLTKKNEPSKQIALLTALLNDLNETYKPNIVNDLTTILTIGLNLPCKARETEAKNCDRVESTKQSKKPRETRWLSRQMAELRPLSIGIILSLGSAFALAWIAEESHRIALSKLGFSAGITLALLLSCLQIANRKVLKHPAGSGSLDLGNASDQSSAWKWITAPWLHCQNREFALNIALIIIILGTSTASIWQTMLRYQLTSLACLALAIFLARKHNCQMVWGGAAGAVAWLIAEKSIAGILVNQATFFSIFSINIPALVLLWANGILQFTWLSKPTDSKFKIKMISSTWLWGSLLGILWGTGSWIHEVIAKSSTR